MRLLLLLFTIVNSQYLVAQEIQYVKEFQNINHPQIGYWFITPNIVANKQYLDDFEFMLENTPYDFYFLDAREGSNFYDSDQMHDVVKNIVEKAHSKGVKVGMRLKLEQMEKKGISFSENERIFRQISQRKNE